MTTFTTKSHESYNNNFFSFCCIGINTVIVILSKIYSLRQDEVAAMSGPDEFGEFYHRLRQIRDHHRKNPNEIEEPMQMEFLRMENERQKPSEEMQSGLEIVIKYCNVPGKRPLPGKRPCTSFQGVNVAASIQTYGNYVPVKCPCGPKSRCMFKCPWALTRDTMVM